MEKKLKINSLELRIKESFRRNYLIISGLLLISTFLTWRYHQIRILSFNTKEVTKLNSSAVMPVHIKAYPVGIDVKVKPAVITNGVWPVFPNEAGYVANGKNIIIYGHNKNNIFGPIRYIKKGAKITIITSDDKTYEYEVIKTDVVEPSNLSYIESKDSDTITLYTCVGFLDSKRFIVVADLKK